MASTTAPAHTITYAVSALIQPSYPSLAGSYVPTTARCSCGWSHHDRDAGWARVAADQHQHDVRA